MDFIESSLKEILVEDFGVTYQDIEEARNRKYFLNEICMDSLDEMQLEMTLEKEFNIYLKKPNELHEYSFPEIVECIENYWRANVNNVQKNCNSQSNSNIHEDKRTAVVLKPEAKEHTNKPTMKHPGFGTTVKNQSFCNFIKRKLYENFNKLR